MLDAGDAAQVYLRALDPGLCGPGLSQIAHTVETAGEMRQGMPPALKQGQTRDEER
jgi:hypothetical protein